MYARMDQEWSASDLVPLPITLAAAPHLIIIYVRHTNTTYAGTTASPVAARNSAAGLPANRAGTSALGTSQHKMQKSNDACRKHYPAQDGRKQRSVQTPHPNGPGAGAIHLHASASEPLPPACCSVTSAAAASGPGPSTSCRSQQQQQQQQRRRECCRNS
jgi:hypothetical protein